MARQAGKADGSSRRRGARVALGGLLIVAGVPSTALADTTHGDVDLPALTPEEIQELGLENLPEDQDQPAPGSGEENAADLPDNQDTGTPDPDEGQPDDDGTPDEPGYSGPPGSTPPPASPSPSAPQPPPSTQATPPPSTPAPPPATAGPQAPAPAPQLLAPGRPTPRVGPTPPPERSARPDVAPRTGKPTQRPASRRTSPRAQGPVALPPHSAEPARVAAGAGPAPHSSAPAASADARPSGETVVVQPGDSLWSIARRILGKSASAAEIAAFVDRLWELNKQRIGSGTPDLIAVGERLRIPGRS